MTSSKRKFSRSKVYARSSPEVFDCGDIVSLVNFAGTCFYQSVESLERDGDENTPEQPYNKKRREFVIVDYLGSEEYIVPGIEEGIRDYYRVFHLASSKVGITVFWEEDKINLEVIFSSSEEIRNRWYQEGSSPPEWWHLR